MSHAAVLVVLDGDVKDIEAAVTHEMEPFCEHDTWFADGSRWDWYVIGGRYAGILSGYDPESDPRNFAMCRLCRGTGKRTDMQVANDCNGCSGTGTARNFHNAAHDGDVCIKRDLNFGLIADRVKTSALRRYERAGREKSKEHVKWQYGVDPSEETLEDYLKRECGDVKKFLVHYAYLRKRHWHEAERMGWFGSTIKSECELKLDEAEMDVDKMIRRCKYKDEKTGASIVVWNEPHEVWSELFYKRFIEPLPEDAILVTVDYHV